MLARQRANRFSFRYGNQATPSMSPGTSVVPGTSNAEGSWTEVASAANIAQDIYFITVRISGGATASNSKMHLLDIGWDPAGGTAYVQQIANIACGGSHLQSGVSSPVGRLFRFPIFIKAGSSVAVRVQGSNATPGTVLIAVEFFGQPSVPENCAVGQYSETIGTITNSNGVAFTPGDSGAEGTWVSLGTTTRALWWWQLCVQVDDNTLTDLQANHFDLAFGDGSNKHIIIENVLGVTSGGEALSTTVQENCFCEVPAGAELWVRGSRSGTTDTGWNAVAVGIGG